ncbi:MAG: ABC transporter permease [Clostridium sp.]|nr:ABC transporter permease [Clostridium sp.]
MKKEMDYANIPKEKFEFYQREGDIHDKKLDTKPVGYFKDAMIRFTRNKSSVIAAVIIFFLVLYALLVPVFGENDYTRALTDTTYLQYARLLPKWDLFAWAGWDGCSDETLSEADYLARNAIGAETGMNPIVEVYRAGYEKEGATSNSLYYDVRLDSYVKNGMIYLTLTPTEYEAIQEWQLEHDVQVIYPAVDTKKFKIESQRSDANLWYQCTAKSVPILDKNGDYQPLYKTTGNDGDYHSRRIEGDDGSYRYATVAGTSTATSYRVRVFTYTYFQFRYGFEPSFVFGTNAYGQDIFTRLASGARFSIVFALCISAINMIIGAFYGAIEGYYGGAVDITMERISDILNEVPFVVVVTLFKLHLANKVGALPSLLFAFVLTGWIGMASSTRMQFYRYKNQEYILSARTLGAGDFRLMFRHIFPNALGTLITSAVMMIPGVIGSESNMTYLGIINLDSSTRTSIGSMLSAGRSMISTFPHVILFPALFISLLMISFNLFGNGLRDAFNPSLRGTED